MGSNAPWEICTQCHGNGTIDTLGAVNRRDFDDDEWEEYLEGGHEGTCANCAGLGRVRADAPAHLVRFGRDGQKVQYADADDASEHFLRMAEGLA